MINPARELMSPMVTIMGMVLDFLSLSDTLRYGVTRKDHRHHLHAKTQLSLRGGVGRRREHRCELTHGLARGPLTRVAGVRTLELERCGADALARLPHLLNGVFDALQVKRGSIKRVEYERVKKEATSQETQLANDPANDEFTTSLARSHILLASHPHATRDDSNCHLLGASSANLPLCCCDLADPPNGPASLTRGARGARHHLRRAVRDLQRCAHLRGLAVRRSERRDARATAARARLVCLALARGALARRLRAIARNAPASSIGDGLMRPPVVGPWGPWSISRFRLADDATRVSWCDGADDDAFVRAPAGADATAARLDVQLAEARPFVGRRNATGVVVGGTVVSRTPRVWSAPFRGHMT